MKKKNFKTTVHALLLSLSLASCGPEKPEDAGRRIGKEFCDCYVSQFETEKKMNDETIEKLQSGELNNRADVEKYWTETLSKNVSKKDCKQLMDEKYKKDIERQFPAEVDRQTFGNAVKAEREFCKKKSDYKRWYDVLEEMNTSNNK